MVEGGFVRCKVSWRGTGGRCAFRDGGSLVEIEDLPGHEQWGQMGRVTTCAGEYAESPGVEIAPVGKADIFKPGGIQPSEIVPGAQNGNDARQVLGQEMQAGFVFNDQDGAGQNAHFG